MNLKDKLLVKNFRELYALKYALTNCVYIDENFLDDIKFPLLLTREGKKLFTYLKKVHKSYSADLINFGIFIDFYHDNFFIDLKKTDTRQVFDCISNWIAKEKIQFPWIYGRELYDKYFNEFEEQKEDLNNEETKKLLANSLKGVFQQGNYIISPWGILTSKEKRDIEPTRKIHLWHCPDPSCESFHLTTLSNVKCNNLIQILETIEEYNNGKSVMDIAPLFEGVSDSKYYNPFSLRGLAELIGNVFEIDELRQILQRLIEKESIRDFFPVKLRKGSAKEIVKSLTKDQCLALILISKDEIILIHVENLIEEKIISIPQTEIRESIIKDDYGSYDTFLQVNKLGIRVNSQYQGLAVLKLKKLLKDIYNESPLREQLEWNLRRYADISSLNQKIAAYISDTTPQKVIQDLILNGSIQLNKAFEALPGSFSIPTENDQDEVLIDKIAWKLGFNINLYPQFLNTLWKNLALFKSDVLSSLNYNEIDKAKIRSSAVNLFVSIEEILQQSLSFICWVLLSDHYLDTKFEYVYEDARDFMVQELNDYEYATGKNLEFDPSGKNTLFPLVYGFEALIASCDEIILNRTKYIRPKNEFPSFYQKDPLKIFPFEHKKFVLDIMPTEFQKLREILKYIPSEFIKGDIMGIRNKLQHNRDDFPIQEEILNAINSIEKCFSLLENEGIFPDVYLFRTRITDEYNRTVINHINYKGKVIQFNYSAELSGSHLPSVLDPVIALNKIKIGITNQPLIFEYKEKSSYQSYWKNYPKKKT